MNFLYFSVKCREHKGAIYHISFDSRRCYANMYRDLRTYMCVSLICRSNADTMVRQNADKGAFRGSTCFAHANNMNTWRPVFITIMITGSRLARSHSFVGIHGSFSASLSVKCFSIERYTFQ